MTAHRSPVESLFAALSDSDWAGVLTAVHEIRGESDSVSDRARQLTAQALAGELDGDASGLSDDSLERVLLLHHAGYLSLSDEILDGAAELLVTRNIDDPEIAVGYARFRPEADACRGVLAQFDRAGQSETIEHQGGRVTHVERSPRTDGRRSLFRSRQESVLFSAAQRVFPGTILVPNAALHAALHFESVQGLLSSDESSLFFQVLVDLVVFEAAEPFRALHFIELDSPWHDDPRAEERDRVKERMLGLAGCHLIRIRPPGHPTLAEMTRLLKVSVATPGGPSASQSL